MERTLRTAGTAVCDVRHAVRTMGRKLPFRGPDPGVSLAHQVARPVPGHRDGPRARTEAWVAGSPPHWASAVNRAIVSSISASVVRGLIVHSLSTVRPRSTVELGAA